MTFGMLILGIAAGLATVPAASGQEVDLDRLRIPHTKTVLSNGLTLLVHEDHSVPLVAVNLWYHVGSRNEKRGRTGFAHLFEHFFFNGSEHYPHGFREAMDDLGANNRNGTTNTDRTNFFEDVPVSALERTLYLEADRMGFLAGHLSEEMLERERGVVQNEKRQGENQPYGRAFSRIAETIYPASHPYSWSTIGSMDDLQAATLDDIRDWYKSYYGPNNCVLSLAGDITSEQAVTLVKKYFGALPAVPPVSRLKTWVPRLERPIRDAMEERVPQARIYRVWHAPPWGDAAILHLDLAAQVLTGSRSARLDRRLIYEKSLATTVTASATGREISGLFSITVTVRPGVDPAVAESEIDAVLEEFLRDGPTGEELSRAKTRGIADFIRGSQALGGFGGRADILASSMTYGSDPEAYLAHLRLRTRAGSDPVRDAAREWLRAPAYTLLVSPQPDLVAEAAAVDRAILPALGPPPEVAFPRIQRKTLANGLKLMLMERHGGSLVNLSLMVTGGYASDPKGAAGTAALAVAMMQEGTKSLDTFHLADALDSLGARVETSGSLDHAAVTLRALKMNLAASVSLFADVALNPSFSDEMVALGKRRQIARIGQEKAQPAGAALRLAPRLLYGEGHPYAGPSSGIGDEASVAALSRDDLATWHRAWFRPGSATLVATGDVTMDELSTLAEASFAAWPAGKAPSITIPRVDPRLAGRIHLIDKPGAPQSVIVAAHLSEPAGQPDELAIETVMSLFGGLATSRLNRNLRLDKHWSYGVRGSINAARGQRPFTIIAPVQTDKTKESMIEVAKEIEAIAGLRPVKGEEFESIRRNMTSRLAGRFETLDDLEAAGQRIAVLGVPEVYYYDYASNVTRLSEEDLATAAARYIRPKQIVWIVVGDLAKVEAGIRELGWGEVVKP